MSPVPFDSDHGRSDDYRAPTPVTPLILEPRQIWAVSTPSATIAPNQCFYYQVQSPGTLFINDSLTIDLVDNAVLKSCGPGSDSPFNSTIGDNSPVFHDPYFASTSPVTFVLGVCNTIAWLLLIMLLMTPRTYLSGIGGSRRRRDEGLNVVGVGSRPWFQKVATLFVAIALIIATVNVFQDAEEQYNGRYQDSIELTEDVLGSTEIKVIRFVSTIFEYLAQAQTALRLFPRHRERIAIKWVALSLILAEMIFAIINNFTNLGNGIDSDNLTLAPRRYAYAFPALEYLFELALSLMYAAVIAYYAITKRRFAFYHPDMWNISLVALLSTAAVLIPVVFFVLDIAVQDIAAWGDYIRWVGAAAASVVVWEWVERIEALEREERSDGILGNEVFDEDEITEDRGSSRKERRSKRKAEGTNTATGSPSASSTATSSSRGSATKSRQNPRMRFGRVNNDVLRKIAALRSAASAKAKKSPPSNDVELQPSTGAVRRRRQGRQADDASAMPADPAAAAQTTASPVSRSDCTSASTVYRVVHHPQSPSSTPGISETLAQNGTAISPLQEMPEPDSTASSLISSIGNAFRRRPSGQSESSQSIPPEILAQQEQVKPSSGLGFRAVGKVKSSFGFLNRFRGTTSDEQELPCLIVPWRGEGPHTSQPDLEAGHAHHTTGEQTEEHTEEPTTFHSPANRQDLDHVSTYEGENGQIMSRSGTVTFSEDPVYANRGSARPSDSTSNSRTPP